MAEIINLRMARKQQARDAKDQTAEANRQKFGQTKSEKKLTKLEEERASHELDQHKRDP